MLKACAAPVDSVPQSATDCLSGASSVALKAFPHSRLALRSHGRSRTGHTDERVRTSRVCGIVCVRAGDVLQPCTTRGSDKCLENVRASVLFDAIVGRPSARLATCVRARRPSGAVHHFNPILKSSTRSRTHQEKPQQHCRQALDAHVAEAEQHSLVVSEGCVG